MTVMRAQPPVPRNLHEKICAAQQKQRDVRRRAQDWFPVVMEMLECK